MTCLSSAVNPASLQWIVLAVGAAALGVALVALFAGRSRGRKRCPRCWYDMTGAAAGSLRCPECGHEANGERELLRTRRRWAIGGPALLIAIGCLGWQGARVAIDRDWHYRILPTWKTIRRVEVPFGRDTLRIEEREVRNQRSPDFARMLVISRGDERLFALEGFHFTIGAAVFPLGAAASGQSPTLAVGTDITGDNVPDLVLQRSSGGSGDDAQTYFFSLDQRSRHGGLDPMAVLPYGGRFEDVDADGVLEFIVQERPLDFRWTSRADSPRAEVVLVFREGQYVVALDRMRRPTPSLEALRASLDSPPTPPEAAFDAARAEVAKQASKRATPGGVPGRSSIVGTRGTRVLRLVVDLVYQGNAARAAELLDAEWPRVGGELGSSRAAFDAEFGHAMRHSRFAEALLELNGPGAWWR